MTLELTPLSTEPTAPNGESLHRRRFVKRLAAAGVGLSFGLVACGDNTSTSVAPAAATSAATTVPATTVAAATTVAPAATVAATTAATTTTAAATTAASATTSGATTAAAAGDAPAGYVQVGKLPSSAVPASFTVGDKKGYIYAKSQTEVSVFSDKCTHKGCDVPYVEADKKFECPCHGSQYDPSGAVIKGPATARLPLFDSKVVGEIVYAKLS